MSLKANRKNYIKGEIKKVTTQAELIHLINTIYSWKQESYGAVDENGDKRSFSEAQVKYFLSQLNVGTVFGPRWVNEKDNDRYLDMTHRAMYKRFQVPKKSGGAREIHAPQWDLKALLSCINEMILAVHKPHHKAFGFADGKNVVDNAKLHVGKNYVYNIDLQNFFHSFDLKRVKWGFFNPPFNFNDEREPLAYMLACLCTVDINGKKVLPQGSPASPSLTNVLCWRLDKRLNGLAKRFGAEYSRYADDITFSSDHHIYKGKFLEELKRIIHVEGLAINPKKTRLQLKDKRQVVTGLTVNKEVNVSRTYIGQIRNLLYRCERYGVEKTAEEFVGEGELLEVSKTLYLSRHLEGKLNFLAMVKGKEDPTYQKLQKRFYTQFPFCKKQVDKILEIWEVQGVDEAINYLENAEPSAKSMLNVIDSFEFILVNFNE